MSRVAQTFGKSYIPFANPRIDPQPGDSQALKVGIRRTGKFLYCDDLMTIHPPFDPHPEQPIASSRAVKQPDLAGAYSYLLRLRMKFETPVKKGVHSAVPQISDYERHKCSIEPPNVVRKSS
jgi:hypothetical protein